MTLDASLQHRPDLPALILRWQGEASSSSIQRSYQQLLTSAFRFSCWYWLIDLRRRNRRDEELVSWLAQGICPRLVAGTRIACLVSPCQLTASATATAGLRPPDAIYQIGLFITEKEAHEWLELSRR
jgi:hypothetical protein